MTQPLTFITIATATATATSAAPSATTKSSTIIANAEASLNNHFLQAKHSH